MDKATSEVKDCPEVKIESLGGGKVRLSIEASLTGNLMDVEEKLQEALNGMGMQAMAEALHLQDVDGDTLFLNPSAGHPKDSRQKAMKQASEKRK